MEGRLTNRNTVLVGLVLTTFAVGLVHCLYGVGGMEVQAQGQTGDCPNPQLIDEFGGNGDQETPTFDTTTNQFRVSYETTSTPDPTGDADGNMVVNVRDAD